MQDNIEKIIMKINNDFTGDSAAKKSAVKFLHDCFGDSIDDYNDGCLAK